MSLQARLETKNMEVSLSEFVDFILKSGIPRMTHVKNLQGRGQYSPATDYYKGLREAIVEFHSGGSADGSILEQALARHVANHKGSKYPVRLEAYRRFLGKKSAEWFVPPRAEWRFEDLVVRLNPELGLRLNGNATVIKVYWKEQKLTMRQVELILFMMRKELGPLAPEGTTMAILDLPSAKLLTEGKSNLDLSPLLRSEARAFIELWKSLKE